MAKFKKGDILRHKDTRERKKITAKVIWSKDNRYRLEWSHIKEGFEYSADIIEGNLELANYTKSPLWKKLEGVK